MAESSSSSTGPILERIDLDEPHTFEAPSKKVNDGNDLTFFLSSKAYRDLTIWLLQLDRSMFPVKAENGTITATSLQSPRPRSYTVNNLRALLHRFSALIDQVPPNTGPRRFGNVAFRDWYKAAEQEVESLMRQHVFITIDIPGGIGPEYDEEQELLMEELSPYLLGSFGSPQRLDYGTGHELSFLAFLGCLWKLHGFEPGEESSIVVNVIQPYLHLVRNLIMTYTLEPAGSHGVWGLDDHSFLPYIFGSAQYGPAIDPTSNIPVPTEGSLDTAPSPSAVTDKTRVSELEKENMYFSAIHFIHTVKRGPFWEHSPVLYDISGIKDGWAKINKGMLKMYAAEVLGKFPVVQHFPFGSLYRWETDPEATIAGAAAGGGGNVHARSQPMRSKDVPPAPASASTTGVSTSAPWARPGQSAQPASTAMPAVQASTGVPSTRAPWASASGPGRPNLPAPTGRPENVKHVAPTSAPWAGGRRYQPPSAPGGKDDR